MGRLLVIATIVLALPAAGAATTTGADDRLLFAQKGPHIGRYFSPSFVCASSPDGVRPVRVATAEMHPIDSIDVSLDGSRVAYAVFGNLHIAAVDGSTGVRIGFGSDPEWTPDGALIVYTGPRGVQTIRPDGTGETVLAPDGRSPAVSPGGRTVVFVRGDRLVLTDFAGGGERTVLTRAAIASPDWAPDGSRIALSVGGAVHTVRPDGTDLLALTTGTGDSSPAYSPDGTRVAFERNDDIWLMTASGGDLINVTKTPLREGAPTWQPGEARTPAGSDRPCAIVGTEAADRLVGSEYADFIYDLGGDDTVFALGGSDYIFDGGGDDRIDGGDGDDSILLGRGENVVHGGGGSDVIGCDFRQPPCAAAESQQLFGDGGGDRLLGSNSPDLLDGGAGNDFVIGFAGADRLSGGSGDDRLFSGDGNDRLAGGPGDDQLGGGTGTDVFLGGNGDDHLLARDGRRELVDGGAGRDRAQHDRADRRARVERTLP